LKRHATTNQTALTTDRPQLGRALFYTRHSEGRSTTTPTEYVRWAADECARRGLRFSGTPELIAQMIDGRKAHVGDIFLDWDVAGNVAARPGLEALIAAVRADRTITHVLIPRPDRLSRPNQPNEAVELEDLLRRQLGVSLVFRDLERKALSSTFAIFKHSRGAA
jgi:hypothetical protein